jgi:phenylacetate-CoA ligase
VTIHEPLEPDVQGLDEAEIVRRAAEGVAGEWARVWDVPVPFYRDRFEAAGLRRDSLPDLDGIPRTTKNDIRADEAVNPPFGTHRTLSLDEAWAIARTGGTSGAPVLLFYGERDLAAHQTQVARNAWRHGVLGRGRVRLSSSWPQGLYASGVLAPSPDGSVVPLPMGLPMTADQALEHLQAWLLLRPGAFLMSGSQLQIYQAVADEHGIDLHALLDGAVLVFSEAGCQFEAPRQRIEREYNVRIHNVGGCSDIPGFATSDCRFHTGLHIPNDRYVVQVCDRETGEALPLGERGTMVITAFGLDALCIRYDLEDIVSLSPGPCPCGETGVRYTWWGRVADVAEISGRQVLPLDVQLALEPHGAPEFVLSPGRADVLRLKVEIDGDGSDLSELVSKELDVPVAIEPVTPGSLPRSSFKVRRTS